MDKKEAGGDGKLIIFLLGLRFLKTAVSYLEVSQHSCVIPVYPRGMTMLHMFILV